VHADLKFCEQLFVSLKTPVKKGNGGPTGRACDTILSTQKANKNTVISILKFIVVVPADQLMYTRYLYATKYEENEGEIQIMSALRQ
jgi:hypothetical protein